GDTEFSRQLQEIEQKYNNFSQTTPYQIHSNVITTSKMIDTKEISRLLQEGGDSKVVSCLIDFVTPNEVPIEKNKLNEEADEFVDISSRIPEVETELIEKVNIDENEKVEQHQTQVEIIPKK
ncbi:17400_t:CDS:1, partial [Cetraspora pellucida]